MDKIQAILRYITYPHTLTLIYNDVSSMKKLHNTPIQIKNHIHKHKIKLVLIDGEASLKICNLKVVTNLRLFEHRTNPKKKIKIKDYDEEEFSSKISVTFLIRVGPMVKDVVF